MGLDGTDWGCGCWDGKSYGLIRIFIEEKLGNSDGDIQEIESSWSLWPRGSVVYRLLGLRYYYLLYIIINKMSDQESMRMNFFNLSQSRSILRTLRSK